MKRILIFFFLVQAVQSVDAQIYHFDANLRCNALLLPDDSDATYNRTLESPALAVSGEAVYFPLPFLGVGVFYSRSFSPGKMSYEKNNVPEYFEDQISYDFSTYGLVVQGTTSRVNKFRGYAVFRAGKFELLEDFDSYKVGNSGVSLGVGLGAMIKITRTISFNILEVNYNMLPKKFSIDDTSPVSAIQIQSGVSIQLLQKK